MRCRNWTEWRRSFARTVRLGPNRTRRPVRDLWFQGFSSSDALVMLLSEIRVMMQAGSLMSHAQEEL
jgi:hypothetical protein